MLLICLVATWAIIPVRGVAAFRVGIADVPGGFLGVSGGELTGSLAPVYQCAFSQSGLDVQFVPVPLNRGFYDLDRGELDALMPLARTPDRDKAAVFAGKLFTAEYVFVSLKPLATMRERGGLRYGILRGFVGRIFIPDSAREIEEVSTWAQLLPMLELDRIDAAVMPSGLADNLVEELNAELILREAGILPISMYLSAEARGSDSTRRMKDAVTECRPRRYSSDD